MSHNLSHTIHRGGSFVYNRRVPGKVQEAFGTTQVRVSLGRDRDQAALLSERLTTKLDQIWSSPVVRPVEVSRLLQSATPRVVALEDAIERYIAHKGSGRGPEFEKVVRIAQRVLETVAGNKDIESYDRDDARLFVKHIEAGGAKTATIRRRLNTVKAIFEFTYNEEQIDKRNPFSRLSIPGEGLDATKRGTFTLDQLQDAYHVALATRNEIKLIVPLLGETGCRLAEAVGLRLQDVDLDQETICITPHPGRRLKTKGSERTLPLVGAALDTMRCVVALRCPEDHFLFPRYAKSGTVRATHASNAINKWLRRDFGGLTCHCLRHTMRDRLTNPSLSINSDNAREASLSIHKTLSARFWRRLFRSPNTKFLIRYGGHVMPDVWVPSAIICFIIFILSLLKKAKWAFVIAIFSPFICSIYYNVALPHLSQRHTGMEILAVVGGISLLFSMASLLIGIFMNFIIRKLM